VDFLLLVAFLGWVLRSWRCWLLLALCFCIGLCGVVLGFLALGLFLMFRCALVILWCVFVGC